MPTAGALSAAYCATHQVNIDPASVAARRDAAGGSLRHQQHPCTCCAALCSRRISPCAAFSARRRHLQQRPHPVPRCALRWAPRRGACWWVVVHRCTQQPQALCASAAGNARRAPCTHNDARLYGAKVARRRGAVHARLQSRVQLRAESVCALQTASNGGAARYVHIACEGLQIRVKVAVL
jgi:hypothetical protein